MEETPSYDKLIIDKDKDGYRVYLGHRGTLKDLATIYTNSKRLALEMNEEMLKQTFRTIGSKYPDFYKRNPKIVYEGELEKLSQDSEEIQKIIGFINEAKTGEELRSEHSKVLEHRV